MRKILGTRRSAATCFIILAACVLIGCSSEPSAAPQTAEPAALPPSVALRVLVVNEPELAAAIDRLRGEWSERFGGSLSSESKPWNNIAAANRIEADLVVFPTRYLGELATRGWLRPIRQNVLDGKTYDAADVFPLARRDLVTWGGQVMALPIGVNLPTEGLLVEAAQAATSSDRLGVLFDAQTMKPRITEPVFVDAFAKLNAGSKSGNVPVLGMGDRLLGVATASRNAATAFRLLEWLSSAEISTQLASAADGTMPVRRSLASLKAWYDSSLSAGERNARSKSLERQLSGERYLMIPRIPGIDEYLAALNDGGYQRQSWKSPAASCAQ